jgi:hypothetical protein
MRLRLLARALGKLVVVIVVAGAAGAGFGIGVSRLTDDDSSSSSVDTSTTGSNARPGMSTNGETDATGTATATELTTTARPRGDPATSRRQRTARPVRVRVISSILHRGSTRTGRRSNRARLSVHVRVTNHGKRTIANVRPVLMADTRPRADPTAVDTTRSLLRVRPGSTADGTVRFETAGAVTRHLVSTRRARLRIAGRTATLTVRIGSPVRTARRQR